MPDLDSTERDPSVIIFTSLKCDIDRCLKWGVFLCSGGAIAVVGWVIYLFFWSPAMSGTPSDLNAKKMTQVAYLYPLDSIG